MQKSSPLRNCRNEELFDSWDYENFFLWRSYLAGEIKRITP